MTWKNFRCRKSFSRLKKPYWLSSKSLGREPTASFREDSIRRKTGQIKCGDCTRKFMADPQIYSKLNLGKDELNRTPEETWRLPRQSSIRPKRCFPICLNCKTDRLEKLKSRDRLKFKSQKLQFKDRRSFLSALCRRG